jgi:hypothetical protein
LLLRLKRALAILALGLVLTEGARHDSENAFIKALDNKEKFAIIYDTRFLEDLDNEHKLMWSSIDKIGNKVLISYNDKNFKSPSKKKFANLEDEVNYLAKNLKGNCQNKATGAFAYDSKFGLCVGLLDDSPHAWNYVRNGSKVVWIDFTQGNSYEEVLVVDNDHIEIISKGERFKRND